MLPQKGITKSSQFFDSTIRAVLALSVCYFLEWIISRFFYPGFHSLLFPLFALFGASLGKGFQSGIIALVGSVIIECFIFFEPAQTLHIDSGRDRVEVGLFLSIGLAFVIISEMFRRSRLKLADLGHRKSKLVLESQRLESELSAFRDQLTRARKDWSDLKDELDVSQDRHRATFEFAASGIAHLNIQGDLLAVNKSFATILGFSQEDLESKNFLDLTHPDDTGVDHANFGKLKQGLINRYICEKRVIRKQGGYCWIHSSVALIRKRDGSPEFAIAVVEDISSARASENLLRKKKAEAEAASHQKDLFLANISHELRTPLGIILGYCELAQESTTARGYAVEGDPIGGNSKNPVEGTHHNGHSALFETYFETIQRNAEHLLRLVNDILDVSKIAAKKITTVRQKVALSLFLEEIFLLEKNVTSKGLEFIKSLDSDLPTTIDTDPVRLRQILTNLVNNAIQFTSTGFVELKISLAAPIQKEVGAPSQLMLQFLVRDSGRGLSDDEKNHIFETFYQGDSSYTRKHGGMGLGLALAKQLSQQLGGELYLRDSQIGVGTCFVCQIDPGRFTSEN